MSGKYDPNSWAKQRAAAIARAQAIREERKRGEDLTEEHTFTPNTTPYPSYLKKTNSGRAAGGGGAPGASRTFGGYNGDSLDELAMQMPSPPKNRMQQHGYGEVSAVHNPNSPTDALSKHVNSMSLHELANSNPDDLDGQFGGGDDAHSAFANLLRNDDPLPSKSHTQRVRTKPDWNMDTASGGNWSTDTYAPPNRSTKSRNIDQPDKQDINKARSRLSLLKAKMTRKPSDDNVQLGDRRQQRSEAGPRPLASSARAEFGRYDEQQDWQQASAPLPRQRRAAGEQVARPRQPAAAKPRAAPFPSPAQHAWDETPPPPQSADRRPAKRAAMPEVEEFPPQQIDAADMNQCPDCGRRFNAQAFEKHVKICQKVFMSKRKVFDTQKMRIENTEAAKYVARSNRQKARAGAGGGAATTRGPAVPAASKHRMPSADDRPLGGTSKQSKWRQQSEQFRQAIRQARMDQQAQQKGMPLSALPPPAPSAPDPSLIPCPHCGRRFNEQAAERHIPKCQNIKAKPSRLVRGGGVNAASGRQATEAKKATKRW